MTRHAVPQPELPVAEALQAYADDTKGTRELTSQFKRWRRGAIVGGLALTLVIGAGVRSFFGGGEAPSQAADNEAAGGNASASAPAATKSPEQLALECKLDELRGTKQNSDGSVTLDAVLATVGADHVTYHAVPLKGTEVAGDELPMLGNGGAGPSLATMSVPRELFTTSDTADEQKNVIGLYAESDKGDIDACGSYYIDSGDLNAHFEDPTGDALPPYSR
jgi:hypothetical protein